MKFTYSLALTWKVDHEGGSFGLDAKLFMSRT